MHKFISALYLVFIPFYDVPLSFSNGMPLSAILAFFLFFIFLLKGGSVPLLPSVLFIIFIFFYAFSLFINFESVSDKGFNHVVLYLITFFCYFFVFYMVLNTFGFYFTRLYLYFGLILLAIFGTVEVSLYYVSGPSAYTNFLDHGSNVGTVLGLFPRMRSLFNEPSHLALYLIGIIPILWGFNKLSNFLIIYLISWTFSSSALAGIIFAYFILLLWFSFIKFRRGYFFVLIGLVVSLLAFSKILFELPLIDKLVNLFTDQSDTSSSTRYLALLESYNHAADKPVFGYGPTYYYNYFGKGLFNLYVQIFVESGVVGLSSFIFFILSSVYNSVRFKNYTIIFSLIALMVQYVGMSHYYIPGLWILLAYSFYAGKSGSAQKQSIIKVDNASP